MAWTPTRGSTLGRCPVRHRAGGGRRRLTRGPGSSATAKEKAAAAAGLRLWPKKEEEGGLLRAGPEGRMGLAARTEKEGISILFLFISRIFKWIFKRDLNSFSHATKTSPSQIKYAPA